MNGAADLHPRYERPPGEVAGHATPGQDIDEVQSRVLDPDGHLVRPGGRLVSLGEPDNFRTARLGDFHCSHGLLQSDSLVTVTRMPSNQWTVHDFYPLDYLPTGAREGWHPGVPAEEA
jgi:hypothetical protein